MSNSKIGRPTILTDELTSKLCELIRQGLPKDRACWLVDTSEANLYGWLEKGKQDSEQGVKSVYSIFFDAVKKAESEATLYFYNQIKDGKPGEWQKWARIWEGLQPSVFARRIEVVGDPDKPIPLAFTGMEKST